MTNHASCAQQAKFAIMVLQFMLRALVVTRGLAVTIGTRSGERYGRQCCWLVFLAHRLVALYIAERYYMLHRSSDVCNSQIFSKQTSAVFGTG